MSERVKKFLAYAAAHNVHRTGTCRGAVCAASSRTTRSTRRPSRDPVVSRTGWTPWHDGCCARVEAGVWTVCCRECSGTGVFPVPWIHSVEEGRADPESCSCVACKGTGRASVAFAAPAQVDLVRFAARAGTVIGTWERVGWLARFTVAAAMPDLARALDELARTRQEWPKPARPPAGPSGVSASPDGRR